MDKAVVHQTDAFFCPNSNPGEFTFSSFFIKSVYYYMTGIGCRFDPVIEQLRNKISLQVILSLRMGTLVVYFVFEVLKRQIILDLCGQAAL